MLHVAGSLEALHKEEKDHSWGCKPSSQVRFMSNERASSSDHKALVKETFVQLGHGVDPVIERCTVSCRHLDPSGYRVLTGGDTVLLIQDSIQRQPKGMV